MSSPVSSSRLPIRTVRFAILLAASWIAMTFLHETGHILGGWCCGGTLTSADLIPWHLPYSIFDPDPHPLVTLWCGPVLGVVIPVGLAMVINREWMWFMANFCVLTNGVYLAAAWFSGDRYLDTPKLLEHGANPVTIGIYCLVTISVGYVRFRRHCLYALSFPTAQATTTLDGTSGTSQPEDES